MSEAGERVPAEPEPLWSIAENEAFRDEPSPERMPPTPRPGNWLIRDLMLFLGVIGAEPLYKKGWPGGD